MATQLLMKSQGRVIVSGVGKSGLIARKIAATLTSTGTASLFLHPSDALHGDIGIVSTDDISILISHSGETEELLAMLPYLRQRQIPLIVIVGNPHSSLAKQASVTLHAAVNKEACPLNLAPTVSTTVALAIGDALAVTLMHLKGITSESFAYNHPAGRLGKRLTLRVADLMHADAENPIVGLQDSWFLILDTITQKGLGAVNITDSSGRLFGLITDGDVRRALQKFSPDNWSNLTSQQIMTSNPVTASPDQLAYDAMQTMEQRPSQISVMPVIDDNQVCVGLLRLHDIVRSGIA
ncbi:KpsF/GutQ family sugar-phosphate isomerase [Oscillatoria sp. CS-180]|uniref:KpsF/GutQ family sugar-phosphate isomerase n=1 Tax=Oscillatoria sp. CS-180 TaxID=3021720 RepID=UPI00232E67B5|nr:KpsF/GutQ family sugar-phosphate isomerase [Oscillatoria sp. CS-180]MDB9525405.1 KpsF/GutQ family sugar-phosphate isomerase [Oscillatoria sp. CS-180]